MSLPSGTRLGPYEILAVIGAGGMGEVYRARDERLKRDVAIKVISQGFAANPDRLARFEQEAHAAAALNHPNILAVYDVGASNGEPYVVSELLDGATLRDVLTQGALTMSMSIDIATQVALGLAAAHTRGITHRDIKPENVFVTQDGRVKILDFGLAKLREDVGGASQATRLHASTEPGAVLGTVGYMSPEQVRGQPCDARADIFSLGVVFFEMLTGTRPFRGQSAVETMNAILKEDPPDLSASNSKLTPSLDRLVRHCLEKNPGQRFQSAQDLAFALQSAATGASGSIGVAATAASSADVRRGRRERVAWGIATISLLSALGLAVFVYSRPRDAVTLTRASIPLPDGASITRSMPARPLPIALSPDGRSLTFVASLDGTPTLWVRPLDATAATKLNGTEGAAGPFWSPDSRWIAFFADGRLKRIAPTGGDPQIVCATNGLGGGTWNQENVILFSPSDVGEAGLVRVSAAGGAVSAVTELDRARGETNHIWPQFLPDGRRFVYNLVGREDSGIYVGSLDAAGHTLLLPFTDRSDVGVSTLAYTPGYLLYVHNETLLAQPMDAGSGRLSGQAVPIAEGIAKVGPGSAAFSVSATGTLAYWDGSSMPTSQLTWLSRDGTVVGRSGPPGGYADLALSSDQRRIAVGRSRQAVGDLGLGHDPRDVREVDDRFALAAPCVGARQRVGCLRLGARRPAGVVPQDCQQRRARPARVEVDGQQLADRLVRERRHRVPGERPKDAARHLEHRADRGPRTRRDHADAVQRTGRPLFSGRQMARLHLRRIGPPRGVRHHSSGRQREVADLDERGAAASLARRWRRALLSRARRDDHDRSNPERLYLRGRRGEASFSNTRDILCGQRRRASLPDE
jgi:hypothetical protein